jgi:hypothetical protein
MTRLHIPRLFLIAALGAFAMLALPGAAVAKRADRNHDGIPDRWEKRHNLSLKVNQAHRNQDHEGLNNLQEFENGTNPRDADTDNDGLTDAEDVEAGDSPTDADTDNDGIEDGNENAGTIASFDGTMLTINLFGGGTMTGQVTESTEIKCEGGHNGSAQASGDNEQAEEDQAGDNEASDSADSSEGDNNSSTCTTANLVPGASVQEAQLSDTPGSPAVFEEVKLAG